MLPEQLSAGQVLHGGRYQILSLLKQNDGKYTLLAQDLQTGQLVVTKVLNFERNFKWEDLKLFEREAVTLKALSHPAIPLYIDFFDLNLSDCKGFAMVQTYIDAKSLQDWIESGRTFSEAEIQQIARALLEVLIYLHALHPPVIHRDIKPSNILLTSRSGHSVGEVYLVDFGSVQTNYTNNTRTVVGSYGYMPPEQFGGRSVPASDLYSLGATLVWLVTGTHPADLLRDDMQIDFKQVVVNPVFLSWLKWLMQHDARQRPQSAQVALDALNVMPQAKNIVATRGNVWTWDGNCNQWTARSRTKRLQKPKGSKIIFHKSPEAIEIVVPLKRLELDCSLFFLALFAVVWNWGVLPSFIAAILSLSLWLAFFMLLFVIPGLCMIGVVFAGVFSLLLQTRIYIDHSRITWHYSFLGFNWSRSESRTAIRKLVYTPRYYSINSDGERVMVAPKLSLHIGTREDTIGSDLIEAELEWLAQELSDWLGIALEDRSKQRKIRVVLQK